MKERWNKFLHNSILSEDLPLHESMLNMACLSGAAATAVVLIMKAIVCDTRESVLVLLLLASIILYTFWRQGRGGSQAGLTRYVVCVCCVLLPLFFYLFGGARSGMGAYMVVSFALLFILLRGRAFVIAISVQCVAAIGLYLSNAFHPEIFPQPPSGFAMLLDHLHAILVPGLYLGLLLRFQNALFRREKGRADELSSAKGHFLARMNHELRTPLNAVIGLSYLAKQETDLAKQNRELQKIEAAAGRLLVIIGDILDTSKIEAGKFSLFETAFGFHDMLDDALGQCAPLTKARGQAVEVVTDDVPEWLVGDDARVKQVLVNLLDNASKYSKHGTPIRLIVRVEEDDAASCRLRFDVKDTGPGVKAEEIGRIFVETEKIARDPSRRSGGSGLGLAVSKYIVDLMGGHLWAVSAPGRGSTFSFTITFRKRNRELDGLAGVGDEGAPVDGMRVLVADDMEINRMIFVSQLEGFGVEVVEAADGREALDAVAEGGFDLVFMDVHMPVMSGPEAARRIRALGNEAAKGVPIVALTACTEEEDLKGCLDAGMDDWLIKPASAEAICCKCRKYAVRRAS
ncbi:MAG: response regulator [Clostridiales Family XIII bacterium]|jgi:signal transduction histidine kinase|nr:response regulator [Clostridiales Family XIII bacterium]